MRYRYPGIQPFGPKDKDIFFGRDKDIADLTTAILVQKLVVLHSKSGMGKSSLIQAGLIPHLESEKGMLPVPVRLGAYNPNVQKSPLAITRLKVPLKDESTYLDQLIPSEDSLWYYLKKLDAQKNNTGTEGEIVLIFDQFEELFTYPQHEIDAFKHQLAEVLYLTVPQRIRDIINANYGSEAELDEITNENIKSLFESLNIKVLFSIRSDKLSLLDQLSDVIPTILHQWFELQPLKLSHAEDAILEPAYSQLPIFQSPAFDYSNRALDRILNYLSNNHQDNIESFQLQIICQYAESVVIKENKSNIDIQDLKDIESIFKTYYDRQIDKLPGEKEQLAARKFIEEGLIFEKEERRINLYEGQIYNDYHISPQLLRSLVENRLVRPEPDIRGGMSYELCHDTLVKPILESKARRLEQEREEQRRIESAKTRKRQLLLSLLALGIIGILVAGILQIFVAKQKADILAKVGELLTQTVENEGKDPNLALALANAAYSLDPDNPNSRRIRGKVFSENHFYAKVFNHDSPIFAVAFTPDDKFLLTGTKKGEINLWDIEKSSLVTRFQGYGGEIWNLEITKDGKYIFAEGSSKKIVIWDFDSKSIIRTIAIPTWWVTFHANSREIIMRTGGESPAMASYDIATGEIVSDYTYLSKDKNIVGAKTLNGRLVFVERQEEKMIIWDAIRNDITQTFTFPEYASGITNQVISPDGKFLLTGDTKGRIFTWDLNTGNFLQRFSGHQDRISGIRFSKDGNTFVSSGWDQKAYLWETQTGRLISTFHAHRLATSDIMFSNDESMIVTTSWDGTAKLWPLRENKTIKNWLTYPGKKMALDLSKDQQWIASGQTDGSIQIWDLDGNQLQTFSGHQGMRVYSVVFSPDKKHLYSAGEDKIIRKWDLEKRIEVGTFKEHKSGKIMMDISPDGQRIASGGMDGIIYIWNTENQELIHTLNGHSDAIRDLLFTKGGNELFSGSVDTKAILWSANTAKQIQVYEEKVDGNSEALTGEVGSVDISPDGKTLITGHWNTSIKLWDRETGQLRQILNAEEPVMKVMFTPDGKFIYSGGKDHIVRKWIVESGALERTYQHKDEVHYLYFIPESQRLLSGSLDNQIYLFNSIDEYLQIGNVILPDIKFD